MGGAGVWARPQGGGLLQVLATVSVALMVLRGSSAYLLVRHCQVHQDCSPGEYCQNHQECHCQKDFVREPGGACLAVRRAGEPCTLDEQCSRVDAHLVCYNGRCGCPEGLTRADGSCVLSSLTTQPPTTPRRPPPTNNRPPIIAPGVGGSVFGPVTTCLVIFVTFCVLIVIITYSFRAHSRRHTTSRTLHTVSATTSRRTSVSSARTGTSRDMPPSYNSLPPPSYEQATTLDVASLNTLRHSTCTATIEAAPTTMLYSPDASSSTSYGSLLTRSFLLTPSDTSPSLTDLTAASLHQGQDEPPEALQRRY